MGVFSLLKDIFTGNRILGWRFLFSQHFEDVLPLVSALHCFESHYDSNSCSLYSVWQLQDFLYLWFSTVPLWCVQVWFSLSLFCLRFTELLNYVNLCLFTNLGKVLALFKFFFCPIISFLSFWDSDYIYVRPLDVDPPTRVIF